MRGIKFIINRIENNFQIHQNKLKFVKDHLWKKKCEDLFFTLNSKHSNSQDKQLWENILKIK